VPGGVCKNPCPTVRVPLLPPCLACRDIAYSALPAQNGAVSGARPKLRDDEFTGMTYKDAAKCYLEKVGHAVSMEELLDALRDGGCPVGGVSPKKTLYISLVRGREFKPVPGKSGMLGLRSFYQNRGSDVKGKK